MATAKPAQISTFRNATFQLAVRTHLVSKLMAEHSYTRSDARDVAGALEDAVIEEAALQVDPNAPKVLPSGGILAFILQFIQSPAFAQLIAILISLFVPTTPPTPPVA